MDDNEIFTVIKDLEKRVDNLESTLNEVVRDQNVLNDAVRRMQLDFLTVNQLLHKVTLDRNRPNPQT